MELRLSTPLRSSLGILAISLINEALDEGDTKKTLQALQTPAAKLEGVTPKVAQHYQDTLLRAKREKAQVSAVKCTSWKTFTLVLLDSYWSWKSGIKIGNGEVGILHTFNWS